MKFADLITRLEIYFKDDPARLNKDLTLISDDLHSKFSEYKRIKKVVFKRQVQKAYDIIATNQSFINEIETRIEIESKNAEDDEDFDVDVDSESLDEQSLAVAIKGDSNQANEMITNLYKINSSSSLSRTSPMINTSASSPSLLSGATSSQVPTTSRLFDQTNKSASTSVASPLIKKEVRFELGSNVDSEPRKRKNDTESSSSISSSSNPKSSRSDTSLQNGPKSDTKSKKTSSSRSFNQSFGSAANKELTQSEINFDSFACDQDVKENIFRRIYYILSPEHFLSNAKTPPRGFLLHGPPGCGKTQLVYAIAGELNLPLLKVTSTELISGVSGESEENIRVIFEKAVSNAPCILFIDEIEAISQRRETASKNMEHRIVTQLLSCFDDLAIKPYVPLVVIGATNQVDSLDIGLRRAGRFDQEIPIGIPDDKQRRRILEILCRKIKLNENIDMEKIVLNTPGYVGADLNSLIDEALISALDRRLIEQIQARNNEKILVTGLIDWIKNKLRRMKPNSIDDIDVDSDGSEADLDKQLGHQIEIEQSDFDVAISRVQPSSKREGFATVPDVTWDDIGALESVRDELKTAILAPVKFARQCEIFNFTKPPGILMVGPPGCGKTLLAKAIARESGVNFISVKGPELLNMYVGESERAVRSLFQRARNSRPCVIFFDEIDAICSRRSDSSSDSGSTTRVVNQLLTEMDGLESRKGVFLMAASNRPDIIDPAILRPGRLDKIIYVGLPNLNDRLEILKTITKNGTKPKVDTDVDFEKLAQDDRCKTFTGADLSALVREASEFALKEFIRNPIAENEVVRSRHFEFAFKKIKPSVSQKDCEKYERMKAMCINLE